MTASAPTPQRDKRALGTAFILLGVLSAAPIWWLVAVPVLSGAAAGAHAHHFPYVFAHAPAAR